MMKEFVARWLSILVNNIVFAFMQNVGRIGNIIFCNESKCHTLFNNSVNTFFAFMHAWNIKCCMRYHYESGAMFHLVNMWHVTLKWSNVKTFDHVSGSYTKQIIKWNWQELLSNSIRGSWDWISFSLLLTQRLKVKLFDLICCEWPWSFSSFTFHFICFYQLFP